MQMKYSCQLLTHNDDNVIIDVQGVPLNCFTHTGINHEEGDYFDAEISVYDDFSISKSLSHQKSITQGKGYSYIITGILNIDKRGIDSLLFFELDELYDYGYLDNQMVDVQILRLDISEYEDD